MTGAAAHPDGSYVVVGGGMAGGRAAEFLALRGKLGGRVLLVGGEPERPYHRPQLSKELLGPDPYPQACYFRPAEFYAARGVELRLGVRARALDTTRRTVSLDDGTEVGYRAVILAPGTRPHLPNVPGSGLAGVHLLRTLADAAAVGPALREGARVVVVGGGFIGTEVAAAAIRRGAAVTVVEARPAPLANVLGVDVGHLLQLLHERAGVVFRTGVMVAAFAGDGTVREVELTDGGRLPADLVVVGIGGSPDVEWLADSDLTLDDGIVVDQHCRTSAPDVYAAGDAARWEHPGFGRIRIEHETNAQNQAVAAARNVIGQPWVHRQLPYVWSDQGELALRYVGHAEKWDEVVITPGPRPEVFTAAYRTGDHVVAVLTVNGPQDLAEAERLLADGPFPERMWPGRRAVGSRP